MGQAAFAPAKVNLYLHVGPPGEGGYHPICSLMAFADFGDTVGVHAATIVSLFLEFDGTFLLRMHVSGVFMRNSARRYASRNRTSSTPVV